MSKLINCRLGETRVVIKIKRANEIEMHKCETQELLLFSANWKQLVGVSSLWSHIEFNARCVVMFVFYIITINTIFIFVRDIFFFVSYCLSCLWIFLFLFVDDWNESIVHDTSFFSTPLPHHPIRVLPFENNLSTLRSYNKREKIEKWNKPKSLLNFIKSGRVGFAPKLMRIGVLSAQTHTHTHKQASKCKNSFTSHGFAH